MEPVLGVVVALSSELRTLTASARTDGFQIRYLQSGIGIDRARDAAVHLEESGVAALASLGLSGGLDPQRAPGDLIVAEAVLEDGPSGAETVWSSDSSVAETIRRNLTAHGLNAFGGSVITSRRAVLSVEEKKSLYRKSGAMAVDMESAGVARAAVESNLPFFCIRAVCDPAGRSVTGEMMSFLDSSGRIRWTAVLARIVTNPVRLFRFLESGREFSAARRALHLAWEAEVKTGIPRMLSERKR
jgi:adenosylhomocysteine nucleosidase